MVIMPNITQAVSEIVKRRPFLEEGLSSGIINHAYLADSLKDEIERMTGKHTNRYAIIMAIRRLSESLSESFAAKAALNLHGSELAVISGISEITVSKSAATNQRIEKMYARFDPSKGDFLTITQGLYESTIIFSTKHAEIVKRSFMPRDIIYSADGLASLIVKISGAAADSVGVLYALTKILSWENINIIEMVSTRTEEIFILKEGDAAAGFSAIAKAAERKR